MDKSAPESNAPRRISVSREARGNLVPKVAPFAGRLGGNQQFVADQGNEGLLEKDPDAAPGMTLREQFDLRQFRTWSLWKSAMVEGMGSLILVFVTSWANIAPPTPPPIPSGPLGVFGTSTYVGALNGGISNFLILTLCIISFGPVSGGHLNPLITFATFTGRLCTLPRMVLYITFQLIGASIAGLLVRGAYGTRQFIVGGCWVFTDLVPVRDAFTFEFVAATALIFLSFGVGLDPRQKKVIPASLSPFLVGLVLGFISWTSGYTRHGFSGASMNPARCFGVYVGSSFPNYHWYHWVGAFCAGSLHGIFYYIVPPYPTS
ncbi:MIP transporter [Myriangium duriaei CBS 260.36]|uniref:MIP transporter n=1 Tax=Myriangium duriaei CBS 260.36 TaxID=1168546 RepID=A0A9P4MHX9_9PEZI|nr:MIP transporter [Myriangium duriaei CBS 260.36]